MTHLRQKRGVVIAMVQKRLFLALTVLAASGLVGVPAIGPADAQGLADRRPRDDNAIEPGGYSLDDAVELAQSRYRAKAVKAEVNIQNKALVKKREALLKQREDLLRKSQGANC